MAQIMRRILIHHARSRNAGKRDVTRLAPFPAVAQGPEIPDVLLVDQALTRLSSVSPRHAQIVQVRFFGGLEIDEIAAVMSLSTSTVDRDWRFARAWLQKRFSTLSPETPND